MEVYWNPDAELASTCALSRFIAYLSPIVGRKFASYEELHAWSVGEPQFFWQSALRFLKLTTVGDDTPSIELAPGPIPLSRRWFPNVALNFTDNLLSGSDGELGIVAWSEDRLTRRYTFGELRENVARVADFLSASGVSAGDRVFGYLPNIPEGVISMLGAAKIGATWAGCGTDYQVEGVIKRIERVRPRVLVAASHYLWRGEVRSLTATLKEVLNRVDSIQAILLIDYLGVGEVQLSGANRVAVSNYETLSAPIKGWQSGALFPFSHPLYVLFSSGTTGTPKGIVHGAGNTLLEHKKEQILHCDIRPGDRLFYQTSASWMMWNWLVSGLASGATIVLYDGDPFAEHGTILWRLAEQEDISHFGSSAAYLGELRRRAIVPRSIKQNGSTVQLVSLRAIFSTGSVLSPELYDFVRDSIKATWLQSISGGTDIVGCFGLGCPIKPVIRGEVQSKSLGYDVQVLNQAGKRVIGEQGELVCKQPAPSMPLYFLDDPEGVNYRAAYFQDFPGIWRHGDLALETPQGGLVFKGRSDTTLKPGGVRVATADIYSALEKFNEITQALAVGFIPQGTTLEQIALFVVLTPGKAIDPILEGEIKQALRDVNTFFVPAIIVQAPDLPKTVNNKLSELSVKRILNRVEEGSSSSLANPECLEFFRNEVRKGTF